MSYRRSLAPVDGNQLGGHTSNAPPSVIKATKTFGSSSQSNAGAASSSSQMAGRIPRPSALPTRTTAVRDSGYADFDQHGATPRQSQNQIGASSVNGLRNARDSTRRTSTAVASTPATGRRSVSGRASLAPGSVSGRESLFFPFGAGLSQTTRETRPVKTKAFQESVYSVLISALGENNMAGGQVIKKAVREPTQLAFVDMFQTIWKRFIDPDYVFESSAGTTSGGAPNGAGAASSSSSNSAGAGTVMSKAVDEIITNLKEIHYPGMEDMTKSRLSAAGSTGNWPYCLSMLGWLVQIGDKINDEAFPIGPCNRQLDPEDFDQDEEDAWATADFLDEGGQRRNMAYFYPFLYKTYDKFWKNQDDFPEEREELERIFDARDQQVLSDLEHFRLKARDLTSELTELASGLSPLEEARKTDELLVSDIKKFQDYFAHHIKRKLEKFDAHIKRFASTEAEVQQKRAALVKERDLLQTEVDAQPMTSDEYDRLESHWRTLQEQLLATDQKQAHAEGQRGNVELEAYRHQNVMEEEFKLFNAVGREIGLFPLQLQTRDPFSVKKNGKMETTEELTFERGEMFPHVDVKQYLRQVVHQMRERGGEKRKADAEEKLHVGQKYDGLLDGVQGAREELAESNKLHDMTRSEIDQINQTSKDEGEFRDEFERGHHALIHELESSGQTAVNEQIAREARLRRQMELTVSETAQHAAMMRDEMAEAMYKILNMKDDVLAGLERLSAATKANGVTDVS